MAELSQEQLEELVVGKPEKPRAVFYEQAVLNHSKSKVERRRIYDRCVFIKMVAPGTTDWQPYIAQQKDFRDYPEEYAYFLGNKQGERIPSVEIIPGLDIVHKQELLDTGFINIKQLAEAINIPEHLEYARRAAAVLVRSLEEIKHAKEETKPDPRADVREPDGREPEPIYREETRAVHTKIEDLPPQAGRDHIDHVGRRELAGVPHPSDERRQGLPEVGQVNTYSGAEKSQVAQRLFDDWKVNLNWVH